MLLLTRCLAIVLSVACASPALAEPDFQQWIGMSARVALSEEWSLQNDNQVRFSRDREGLFQVQSSLLLAYKLTPRITAAAGYLHSPAYAAGEFTFMERRAREQISFDNIAKLGPGSLGARVRAEQRWRDDQPSTAWRVRPFLRYSIPLGGKTAPTLHLSEELFVNLNTTGLQRSDGIERLRSAAMLAIPLSKGVRLEAGYLNQHRFVRGGADTGEHVLTGSLALSL